VGFSEKSDDFPRETRFLIVDDNEMNQIILTKMLKRLGYIADPASSGYIACEMALATRYDIIFMDMMMPEMNGIETARRIMAIPFPFSSPIIIGVSAGDFKESCLSAGMHHFLSKPYKLSDLAEAINKFM
jgi:CheY-like chemotaxis protein